MDFARLLSGYTLMLFATAAQAGGVTHQVVANANNTFSPAILQIAVGDSVTFRNASLGGTHNVVSNPGSAFQFRCALGCDHEGGLGMPSPAPWIFILTFGTPGTFGYFSELHGSPGTGMFGTIIVGNGPVDHIFKDGFDVGA